MSTHTQPHTCTCYRNFCLPAASMLLLIAGITWEHLPANTFLSSHIRPLWYVAAYLPVGFPVLRNAWESLRQKDFFNEYSLMLIATTGAFLIGEYPEGVAVMLFYAIGELFQDAAVTKAEGNIKALLDIRPDTATVVRNGVYCKVNPESVAPGETLLVKAGEKVPLDGQMLSPSAGFNTSALTGESRPRTLRAGQTVLAGMISIDNAVEIRAEKAYSDSSLARILEMVEEAGTRKSKTELLIRRFAKIYTPAVFLMALGIALTPYYIVPRYVFADWAYRALIFLVISCPCALVISVPLGYFGGIGAASRNGILFKGANFLDLMASLNTVVMDKTGTVTKGVFRVQEVVSVTYGKQDFLRMLATLEKYSNHPVAKAITAAWNGDTLTAANGRVEELAGRGVKGYIDEGEILAGNRQLMQEYGIDYDRQIDNLTDTVVVVAVNNRYAGYVTIADEIKDDAAAAIQDMRAQGIRRTVMLSGDQSSITRQVALALGIDEAFGDLLPEGKVQQMERIKADKQNTVAFAGDGINDAPVLALSDVGIAMGGIGSDAAIEVADVVIPSDSPSMIAVAIRIAKATKRIVTQNIVLAISAKATVLLLGALGVASMWQAVFADVGVALLAILNSIRILQMKFTAGHNVTSS